MISITNHTKKEFEDKSLYPRKTRSFPDGSDYILAREDYAYVVWVIKNKTAHKLKNYSDHHFADSYYDIGTFYNELTDFKRDNVLLDIEDIIAIMNL